MNDITPGAGQPGAAQPGAAGSGRVPGRAAPLLTAALLAGAVTAALYAAGRWHTPDYEARLFGQAGLAAIALKSALATAALALAAVQVLLALWLYRKLPWAGAPPRRLGTWHRAAGIVTVGVTLPVAVHCLIAYGVQLTSLRVGVHSLAGCFLYGAFAAKVLLVRSRRVPRWALPVAGGLLAVTVAVLWYTSALWYYHGFRLP